MTNKYFLEIYIAPSWLRSELGKCNIFNNLDDLMILSNKYISDLMNLDYISRWEFIIYRIESIEIDGMVNTKIFEFRSFDWVTKKYKDGHSESYITFKPNYNSDINITKPELKTILKHWNKKEIKDMYEKSKKRV